MPIVITIKQKMIHVLSEIKTR